MPASGSDSRKRFAASSAVRIRGLRRGGHRAAMTCAWRTAGSGSGDGLAVAQPVRGPDRLRRQRRLKFRPQVPHVAVDGAVAHHAPVGIGEVHQRVAGEDAPGRAAMARRMANSVTVSATAPPPNAPRSRAAYRSRSAPRSAAAPARGLRRVAGGRAAWRRSTAFTRATSSRGLKGLVSSRPPRARARGCGPPRRRGRRGRSPATAGFGAARQTSVPSSSGISTSSTTRSGPLPLGRHRAAGRPRPPPREAVLVEREADDAAEMRVVVDDQDLRHGDLERVPREAADIPRYAICTGFAPNFPRRCKTPSATGHADPSG